MTENLQPKYTPLVFSLLLCLLSLSLSLFLTFSLSLYVSIVAAFEVQKLEFETSSALRGEVLHCVLKHYYSTKQYTLCTVVKYLKM